MPDIFIIAFWYTQGQELTSGSRLAFGDGPAEDTFRAAVEELSEYDAFDVVVGRVVDERLAEVTVQKMYTDDVAMVDFGRGVQRVKNYSYLDLARDAK